MAGPKSGVRNQDAISTPSRHWEVKKASQYGERRDTGRSGLVDDKEEYCRQFQDEELDMEK